MKTKIMAFDPGGTTGWASMEADMHLPTARFNVAIFDSPIKWKHGQLGNPSHHKNLYNLLQRETDDFEQVILVTESFEMRSNTPMGVELISREYIGVIRLFGQQNYYEVEQQTAAQGKVRDTPSALIKPDNLKKLGMYVPGQPHSNDAKGHLLFYMIKHRINHQELLERGWK